MRNASNQFYHQQLKTGRKIWRIWERGKDSCKQSARKIYKIMSCDTILRKWCVRIVQWGQLWQIFLVSHNGALLIWAQWTRSAIKRNSLFLAESSCSRNYKYIVENQLFVNCQIQYYRCFEFAFTKL